MTTNMERFKGGALGSSTFETDKKAILEGKERIRSVNIVYGN